MLPTIPEFTNAWVDGSGPKIHRANESEKKWPHTPCGTHVEISHMTPTGTVVVCKSLPGIAYVGADKHTRKYRVKHRRCWPLLPKLHLYSGPNSSSPIWATYRAKSFREASVELPCRSTGSTAHGRVKVLRKNDGRRNKYVFTMKIRGHKETFGWRRSRHPRTRDLGLSGNGYKLVRLTKSTRSSLSLQGPRTSDRRQIVAIAGRSHHVVPRRAAFRCLTSFGDEWEAVALVTLLAFWIWDRKHMSKG
ncbi:hypothetical protein GGS21DRAFT_133368 [Xylaria nigripes]|nr:hypothetical protein GGS21DRAFT_133368 [Xylaria nigripes]